MAKYIDADEALKQIKELQETDPATVGKKQFAEGFFCGLDEAEVVLMRTSTVDVAEVKHGKWIDKYKGKYANPVYICSVCEKPARYKFVYDELDHEREVQDLSPYCPHCGAKTEEGAD